MVLEWTVDLAADFSDDVINRLSDMVREQGYDKQKLISEIDDEVCGWDDSIYNQWGTDQTEEVIKEVLRRVGGIQLSMFDKE